MLNQIVTNMVRRVSILVVIGVSILTIAASQRAFAVVSVNFAPGTEASPTGLTPDRISALKATTFNTLVLFSITIDTNGNFYYGGGGGPNILLCTNGAYVGPSNWGSLLSQCKAAPSSMNRIEMCIGGWLDQSFVNIKNLIAANGTNSSTVLYQNLNALKSALGLDAMDYDEEYLYDSGSAVQFGKMCASVGMKVTLCPYTNPSYWQAVKSGLGTNVDYVYLQCYAGGQGNDPATWSGYFGGSVPVLPGDWDADGANSFLGIMQTGAKEGCAGGWYWPNAANGNIAPYVLNLYANLINFAFTTNSYSYWQGGASDFNNAVSWSGGVVPGTNTIAINDSGSNNIVQINTGDPAWNVNGLWAGNGTNMTGAYIQAGSTVNITNFGGWLRLGASPGAVGYYTLNSGTLNVSNNLTDIGENGVGVLNLNGGSAFLGNVIIGVNSNSTGTVNLNGGILNVIGINSASTGSSTNTFNFNGGTIQASADNSSFMSGLSAAKIQAGGVVFDSQGHNITISQALAADSSGTGSLTKTGAGTLTLTAYNTFTGPTIVNGGTLAINGNNDANSVLSFSSSLTISNGGMVSVMQNNCLFGYGSHVVPVAINAGSALTIGSGLTAHIKGVVALNGGTLASADTGNGSAGTWNLDQGTVTVNGGQLTSTMSGLNVLLASPTTFNVSAGATSGIDLSVPGYFYGGALVKSGAGIMMLSGTNTYSGGTTVSAGILQLGDGATRNGVVSGNIANNAALGFANPNAQTYSGVISGTGALTKTGAGTLTLTAYNTFTGPTVVNGGTIIINGNNDANSVLSFSSSLTISNGGMVSVLANNSLFGYGAHAVPVTVNAGGTLTIGNGLTAHIKGTVTLNGGTLASADTGLGGAGTWNLDQGTVTVNGGQLTSTISALNVLLASPTTFNVSSGATNGIDLSVPGYFYGGGLVKNGTGTMMLSGTNTYSDGTTVSAGMLQLGDGTSRNGVVVGNIINNAALGFANPNAQTYSGVISGTGALTKTGAGTLSLAGINIYSGSTTLSNGTMALTGSGQLSQSGLINVMGGTVLDVSSRSDQMLTLNIGQTLKGSGSVNGKLSSLAGSTISPGDAIGHLTVQNNITLAGQLIMELNRTNGQNCDEMISTAGSIAGGGTLTVTNLGPALQLGDTFQLFNKPAGGFSTINLPNVSPYAWANNVAVDGSVKVAVASMNPTNITIQVVGSNFTLSWPLDHTGWQLQIQTNGIGTNWTSVPGSTSTNLATFLINTSYDSVFFRLIYSP
jgi:autotransporter-associated beta strand protein